MIIVPSVKLSELLQRNKAISKESVEAADALHNARVPAETSADANGTVQALAAPVALHQVIITNCHQAALLHNKMFWDEQFNNILISAVVEHGMNPVLGNRCSRYASTACIGGSCAFRFLNMRG